MQYLTREYLDKATCQEPDCNDEDDKILYFNSKCHPQAPLEVYYDNTVGAIHMNCSICFSDVAGILVLESPRIISKG